MLTDSQRETLAATLPAVQGALGDITPTFYRRLFAAHPGLLDNLFNRTHQKTGEQPQALAGSIAAFAALQLEPDVRRQRFIIDRIAHKHASLGVTREQYDVVHEHLFAAIVEVLGSAVTPPVADAWDQLYWDMADLLITAEADLYAGAGVESGAVWRDARVVERTQVAPDTIAFTVAGVEPLPTFRPGQYISVQVELADGAHQIRQYSLTGSPDATTWTFSVKLAGEVSGQLHEQVFEGDILRVSTPFGDLVLPEDDSPIVMASAGIGCTPVIGLLTSMSADRDTRPITVLHADRSRNRQPHRGQLAALVESLPNGRLIQWYEHGAGHLTSEQIRVGQMSLSGIDVDPTSHVMLCGPTGFMASVRDELLDRDFTEARIHYETFGPELLRAGAR
ncbi:MULTISPECIES: globin domain-containing protein [unclassified Gordonia (in: high G+C Gram-positive bacteria)]|uniref:globin domain-containing protein n=1 Tax=unclassified Gordonia (in: high G+C Gram-positive bacteria) TaxID=2657482 RepID=UPI001F0D1D76|nr:globin domain-containing protein [Gordonia sp. ABSL49_1]MCH5644165.1 FAD-binding oxidoreductase [Gordonia sp. ABSL49_1]